MKIFDRFFKKEKDSNLSVLVVEPLDSKDFDVCEKCHGNSRKVWGYLHRGEQTEAAYFVEWTLGRVAEQGAHIDLIIGRWGDKSQRSDRFAVSLEFRHTETGPWFMLIDSEQRDISHSELVGKSMARENVIGTPLAKKVFEMVDAIWLCDERITEIKCSTANK
jgi:hypothetical protein